MTFGSLFAGIGGFDLGLERAGMECRWQVEIDPFCRKVLAKHWPDVTRYEDVRDVGRTNLEPVDLICGGFPCQDISYAGKGAGLEGERSGLWSEYARIVRELRPRYVLVENVAALLGRGMGDVLGTLAALGYDAEWSVVPASAVGAPHERERVFLVAHTRGHGLEGIADEGITPCRWPQPPQQLARLLTRERGMAVPAGTRGGVHDGLPGRVDRLRALGNAVVPQVAEMIGRAILQADA